MFLRYGRTIEKRMSFSWSLRVALLGASASVRFLGLSMMFNLLLTASTSIYVKLDIGFVDSIGRNALLPLHHLHPSGISNGISSVISISFLPIFSIHLPSVDLEILLSLSRAVFFNFFSSTSFSFSARICWSSSSAVPSEGS